MSPGKVPAPPDVLAAQLADGAVLKTSGVDRIEGRETVRFLGGDLDASDVVRDLITFSLFTWRRARPDDAVPAGQSRMGWYGDPDFGSRLWLLRWRKLTTETLADARAYAEEALAWLVPAGILASVQASASVLPGVRGAMALDITIRRPEATSDETIRYDAIWET
jgi:phage gp46-like protein